MPAILPNPLDNPITVPDLDHMCCYTWVTHIIVQTLIPHVFPTYLGKTLIILLQTNKISKFENVRFLSCLFGAMASPVMVCPE